MKVMSRKGLPSKIFSQRALIRPNSTGGPYREVSGVAGEVAALRKQTLAIVERRIERYCAANNVELIEPAYLDGIEVINGDAYFRLRIIGQIKPKLKAV